VVVDSVLLQAVLRLANIRNNPEDGRVTCSGVADASGIVVASAAGAGDPTAVVLVVWDSEDRKERRELEMPNKHP
jgi:hypothetical protein